MHAVLIGINYVGKPWQLRGCHQDVEDVKHYLQRFAPKFYIMTDRAHETRTLPTRANIVRVLRQAVANVRAGDTLYVHYSGHGMSIPDNSGDEPDGMDECICPMDFETAGVIRDDDLRAWLVDALPQGAKLRVVMDSCHSGSALDVAHRFDGTWHTEHPPGNNTQDVVFVGSCRDADTTREIVDTKCNGLLTRALLARLNARPTTWLALHALLVADTGQNVQVSFERKTDIHARVDI